jgi:hypothetical protein
MEMLSGPQYHPQLEPDEANKDFLR